MTSPEQAMAARLTAAVEHLHALGLDDAAELLREVGFDCLSHVETLTQQVAELRAGRVRCRTCGADDAAIDKAECYNCRNAVCHALEEAEQENARLTAEIDAAWFGIDHGFDIESRAELEKQSKTNGFKYGLAQAVHHMWKRNPKVQQAEQARDAALTSIAKNTCCAGCQEAALVARAALKLMPAPAQETERGR